VIESSASPRGCVVTCAPAFELGEMAASEIQLRCYPVRVIMQSSSGSLANPEFAGLLGGDDREGFDGHGDFGTCLVVRD
jgi:hypothetical protein